MNLPNFLTCLRFALAPVIVWMVVDGNYRTAVCLAVVAGVTDFLDGHLARTRNQQTKFGQYADPLADKLMLSGAFLAFGIIGVTPYWLVEAVFGRDLYLFLASVISMRFSPLREFRPSLAGKLNTSIQILYVVLMLAAVTSENTNLFKTANLLVWPITALAFYTAVHYTVRGILHIRHD